LYIGGGAAKLELSFVTTLVASCISPYNIEPAGSGRTSPKTAVSTENRLQTHTTSYRVLRTLAVLGVQDSWLVSTCSGFQTVMQVRDTTYDASPWLSHTIRVQLRGQCQPSLFLVPGLAVETQSYGCFVSISRPCGKRPATHPIPFLCFTRLEVCGCKLLDDATARL
jgi:hypothetical protein